VYATRVTLVRRTLVAATGRWLDRWRSLPMLREIAVQGGSNGPTA
jgi:hypothetical protein